MQPTLFAEPSGSGGSGAGMPSTANRQPAPSCFGAGRVTENPHATPFQMAMDLPFAVGRLPAPRVQNAMWAALNARRHTPPYLNASERALFERLDAARCARLARMQ